MFRKKEIPKALLDKSLDELLEDYKRKLAVYRREYDYQKWLSEE